MLISLSAAVTPLKGLSWMRSHSSWSESDSTIQVQSGRGACSSTEQSTLHPFNISTEVIPKVTFFQGFKYKLIFNRVWRFVEIYKQEICIVNQVQHQPYLIGDVFLCHCVNTLYMLIVDQRLWRTRRLSRQFLEIYSVLNVEYNTVMGSSLKFFCSLLTVLVWEGWSENEQAAALLYFDLYKLL